MQGISFDNQNVLILAPHADDEIIGCGGLMQKYLNNNSKVRVLIASFVFGFDYKYDTESEMYRRYDGKDRFNELSRAYEILGVEDYKILYKDSNPIKIQSRLDIMPKVEIVEKLEKEIKNFSPNIIFIPSVTKHQDHKALHEAAITATRPYYWNGSVVIYETDGELSFQPNLFVSLTKDEVMKKAEALGEYKTQIGSDNHPTNCEFLLTKAKYRGQSIYKDFAEAFQVVRLHG